MQKNKFGFTFVELFVVITLLSVISIYGVASFLGNERKVLFKNEIEQIKKDLVDYNIEIGRNTTDYELTFTSGENSYFLSENKLYKNVYQNISINGGTGTITTNGTGGLWTINIYEDLKLKYSTTINATGSLSYNFSGNYNYSIKSSINSTQLNDLKIIKYARNSEFSESSDIYLEKIVTDYQNQTFILSGSVFKNDITNNKTLSWSGSNYDYVDLYFDKDGIKQKLTIKK